MATVLNAVYCILHSVTQLYFSGCIDPLHQEPQVFKTKIKLQQLHSEECIYYSLLTFEHTHLVF